MTIYFLSDTMNMPLVSKFLTKPAGRSYCSRAIMLNWVSSLVVECFVSDLCFKVIYEHAVCHVRSIMLFENIHLFYSALLTELLIPHLFVKNVALVWFIFNRISVLRTKVDILDVAFRHTRKSRSYRLRANSPPKIKWSFFWSKKIAFLFFFYC